MKFRIWLVFTWLIVILVLCGMPSQDVDAISFFKFPHVDKVTHFGLYFILGLLFMGALNFIPRLKGRVIIYFISIFFCFLYGWLIEILQREFFVGRSYDWSDIWADTAGAIVGVLLFPTIRKFVLRKLGDKIKF